MAKRPENMTPDERLTRIRSLERKVRDLEQAKTWAERDEASCRRWAEEAWKEVRRLYEVCERHWELRQEAIRLLGLPEDEKLIEIARFDHERRTWVFAHPELEGGIADG